MTLVHASLLTAGLAAAAIPILIHLLFRRRRPPISWAAMEILLAALRRQEKRLRLEQWLLLAARCLLFALAGFALARPTLEEMGLFAGGRRVVTIVLDDGAATATRTSAGDAHSSGFERLRTEGAALARGLPSGDSVAVVLASKPARNFVAPATTDREAVARSIEALEQSASATDLSGALALAARMSGGSSDADRAVTVLSEFRLGSLDPASAKPVAIGTEGAVPKLLVRAPADDDVSNVAIVGIEPQRSVDDDSITVVVRVERSGGSNPQQTVHVALDGDGIAPLPSKTVRFEPGQASARVEFVVRAMGDAPRSNVGRLRAHIDEDRMPLDDVRYASFDARGATRVGIVARRTLGAGAELEQVPASRWLARAIEPVTQPGLEVNEIEPASIDARTLRDIDALFVPRPETLAPEAWSALRAFTDRGGLVVFMPSADLDAQRWAERFTSTFGLQWQIAADAPALPTPLSFAVEQPQSGIFTAVEAELNDLLRPIEVTRRVEVRNAAAADVVLTLSDGSPFLLVGTPTGASGGRGLVALGTSALELGWTNLPVKPFMVPFAQELVRRGLLRVGRADRVLIGDRPQAPRDALELALANGPRVAVDPANGVAASPLLQPGVWAALDAANRTVGGVAANVDVMATRPTPQSREVVSAWIGGAATPSFIDANSFGAQLSGGPQGKSIGFWLLLGVAALAIVECAMARLFSHAAIVRGSSSDPGVGTSGLIAGESSRAGATA